MNNSPHREAAFQHALHQAWFSSALEQTKSVFTIASAGIGLSLTLVFRDTSSHGIEWSSVWLVLAIALFAVSAWLCILVFKANISIVSSLANGDDSEQSEGYAGRLQLGAMIAFSCAVIALLFSAICHVWLR